MTEHQSTGWRRLAVMGRRARPLSRLAWWRRGSSMLFLARVLRRGGGSR